MSDAPDRRSATTPPELLAPAVGVLVVIVALSSILDDTGLVEHPWWVALVAGAIVGAAVLAGRTIVQLVNGPRPD